MWEHTTYVVGRIPRVKCKDGKVRNIKVGWSDAHHRHIYSFEVKVINTLLATKNQSKSAEFLNCSSKLVKMVLHRSTERGVERRKNDSHMYGFSHLSVDEKSFKKNHKYVTILSDPISGCILDVSEGRDYKSTKAMIEDFLNPEQLKLVNTVSMDIWKTYLIIAKIVLSETEVVHDQFHLIKYLNEAIDKNIRREVKDNEIL